MKNTRGSMRLIIELASFVMLVFVLVIAFKVIFPTTLFNPVHRNQQQSEQVTEIIVTPTISLPYPPPEDKIREFPNKTAEAEQEVAATATTGAILKVSNTPLPSFTPLHVPTQKPGALSTPIPLIAPGTDPAGKIFFSLKEENNEQLTLSYIDVDSAGLIKSEGPFITPIIPVGDVFPSPDGTRLAIVGAWGVGIIYDLQTGKSTSFSPNLSTRLFFNWYPDNHRALIRTDFGDLVSADPISGDYSPVTSSSNGFIDGAAASPDGLKIIYSFRKDEFSPKEIWLVNSDGTDVRMLFTVSGSGTNFAWSPDGKHIVYYGDGWTVMDTDGVNKLKLDNIALPQCYFLPPQWSPDSRYIAFTTSTDPGVFCQGWSDAILANTNIEIYDTVSGISRPILSDKLTGILYPAWSPDGSQLGFVSDQSGKPEIWLMNIDGTNLRQITSFGKSITFVYWKKP